MNELQEKYYILFEVNTFLAQSKNYTWNNIFDSFGDVNLWNNIIMF